MRRREVSKNRTTLGAVEQTGRGFEVISFVDRNGVACSLQASSLAEYEEPGTSAVWLGCIDADPKIFVPNGNPSWRPVEMPEGYIANTRAHLGREQVEALIGHLQSWLDNGTFEVPTPTT
jgi:hypothetical protein